MTGGAKPVSYVGATASPDFSITVAGTPEHPVLGVFGEIDSHKGVALVERVNALLDA